MANKALIIPCLLKLTVNLKLEDKTPFLMEFIFGIGAFIFFWKWRRDVTINKSLKRQVNFLVVRIADEVWLPEKRKEREKKLKYFESCFKDYDETTPYFIPEGKELLERIYKEAFEKNERLNQSGW